MRDVSELWDRLEIRDVVARYARGVDRLDLDLVRSCYHPDAFDDHGLYRGDIDGLIAWLGGDAGLRSMERTMHIIANHLVDLHGDRATAETYCVAYHRVNGADMTVGVRYVDRLERRDGRWAIVDRVVVHEWIRRDSIGETSGVDAVFADAELHWGRRDRTDLSYVRDGSARGAPGASAA